MSGRDTFWSQPHLAIYLGVVLPYLNGARERGLLDEVRRLGLLHALAAGPVLPMAGVLTTEYHLRIWMHGSRFYLAAAVAFRWIPVMAGRSSVLRWREFRVPTCVRRSPRVS